VARFIGSRKIHRVVVRFIGESKYSKRSQNIQRGVKRFIGESKLAKKGGGLVICIYQCCDIASQHRGVKRFIGESKDS